MNAPGHERSWRGYTFMPSFVLLLIASSVSNSQSISREAALKPHVLNPIVHLLTLSHVSHVAII